MSRATRLAVVAAAAVTAVPLLSGCHTSPDAAAIIGSDRVSTSTLQDEVNAELADPGVARAVSTTQSLGGGRVGFTRFTLSRLIGDDLISKVAAAHHVTVSAAEVTAQTNDFVQQSGSITALREAAAQQVGVGAKELPSLIRYTVLQQKLGTALTATLPASAAQLENEYHKDIDSYDKLQIAQIAVASKSLANRLLVRVRHHPASFAALASRYSTDTASKAAGGLVGLVPRSQVVSLVGSASKAKPGSFALAHASGQFVVLHVIKREVTPLADVVDQVKAALFASQSGALLQHALTAEATKLGVHVNPRYGTWDNSNQSVVQTKSPISTTG